MTIMAADKQLNSKQGIKLPFAAGVDIFYVNALIAVDSDDGYAYPCSDDSTHIFMGVNTVAQVDNSAGSAGDKDVIVARDGVYLMTFNTVISQAAVGLKAYCVDDNTVDLVGDTTSDVFVGVITQYVSATTAWVDITPATKQTDVASHIADASGAHAGTAISQTNSDTSQSTVGGCIDELYTDLVTAQAFLPIPLTNFRHCTNFDVSNISDNGGVLASDTTPLLDAINGATDGCQRLVWASSTNTQIVTSIPIPPDFDSSKDIVIHFRSVSGGTTNAVGFSVATFFNEADTKVSDVSTTNQTVTWAEKIATIAAADIPAGAQTMTIGLTPVAHTTDTMAINSVWLEYTREILTS